MEEDPNIKVSLTELEDDMCIKIDAYGITLHLHTRSAVDLVHKLDLCILDFINKSGLEVIKMAGYKI